MKRSILWAGVAIFTLLWAGSAIASPLERVEIRLAGVAKPVTLQRSDALAALELEGKDSPALGVPAEPVAGQEPTMTLHRFYASGFEDRLEYFPGAEGQPGRFKVTNLGPSTPWSGNGWFQATESGDALMAELMRLHGQPQDSSTEWSWPVAGGVGALAILGGVVARRLRMRQVR